MNKREFIDNLQAFDEESGALFVSAVPPGAISGRRVSTVQSISWDAGQLTISLACGEGGDLNWSGFVRQLIPLLRGIPEAPNVLLGFPGHSYQLESVSLSGFCGSRVMRLWCE